MIITIDGCAATGKSTLAKRLAGEVEGIYLDSGSLYRSFAYILKKEYGVDLTNLSNFTYDRRKYVIKPQLGYDAIYYIVPDHPLVVIKDSDIRTEEISKAASVLSKIPEIRNLVDTELKNVVNRNQGEFVCIAEGRDMGTTVFPEAGLKFFITASIDERTRRRYHDIYSKEIGIEGVSELLWKQTQAELEERDQRDMNREVSPLKMADDAILIDNTNLTIDEVIKVVKGYIIPCNRSISEKKRSSDRQLDYDKTYMKMAMAMSELSHAIRLKVGCIIVSKDDQIVSQGYNGTPAGFNNCCEEFKEDGTLRTKDIVLHAESNAITKCSKSNISSVGSTIYITASPCIHCAKLIIQAGITRVVYKDFYRDDSGIKLLEQSGIEVEHLEID